jgi:hypothetical protein
MYPVYGPGPIMGSKPLEMVNLARRNEYLTNGCARSIDRGKAIHLIVTLEQFRGQSCSMGPAVTLGALSHFRGVREYYKSLVDGWAPVRLA